MRKETWWKVTGRAASGELFTICLTCSAVRRDEAVRNRWNLMPVWIEVVRT